MKNIHAIVALALFGLAMVTGMQTLQAGEMEKSENAPKVIALKFHADWCGSCKAMGEGFTDLQNKLDGSPVLFTELNLTNRTTRQQAQYLAAAMGLEKIWAEAGEGKKTGFVLIINAKTKEVIKKFSTKESIKVIANDIKAVTG